MWVTQRKQRLVTHSLTYVVHCPRTHLAANATMMWYMLSAMHGGAVRTHAAESLGYCIQNA